MTESEAWFRLAEEIEVQGIKGKNYYLCHILDDMIHGKYLGHSMNGLSSVRDIPSATATIMRKRFTSHIDADNDINLPPSTFFNRYNPCSWYYRNDDNVSSEEMNGWRVAMCTLMGFEALEEGN